MKILLSIVFAVGAMAVAVLVVSMALHLDLRAEVGRIIPSRSPIDEILPEA